MTETAEPWWSDHEKLAMTAEFMARQQKDDPEQALSNVIYMISKPWKHNDDYNLAQAEVDLPHDIAGES